MQTENDVRKKVRNIFLRGDGIVSGGALGIDYFATDEALKLDRVAKRIKIFLPSSLELYAEHYRKRADEDVITQEQAEALVFQLKEIRNINPEAIICNHQNKIINKNAYYERIKDIIDASDELVAFHVNKSAGVQYTIDMAREKNIPVKIFEYIIE